MSSYNGAKIIRVIIYILFVAVLVGYSIYNSRIFIAGPQIEVESPQNGQAFSESPLVRVKGKAWNIAFIELNGKQINVDENAYFEEPVLLYPGYNIIRVSAKDKFERIIEKNIEVVFVEDEINTSEILFPQETDLETSTSSATTSLEEF